MRNFIVGCLLTVSAMTSSSAYLTGQSLLNMAGSSPYVVKAYIAGVVDVGDELMFCLPDGTKLDDIVNTTISFLKYTRENSPEKLNVSADTFIVMPLKYMYPCKKTSTQI